MAIGNRHASVPAYEHAFADVGKGMRADVDEHAFAVDEKGMRSREVAASEKRRVEAGRTSIRVSKLTLRKLDALMVKLCALQGVSSWQRRRFSPDELLEAIADGVVQIHVPKGMPRDLEE